MAGSLTDGTKSLRFLLGQVQVIKPLPLLYTYGPLVMSLKLSKVVQAKDVPQKLGVLLNGQPINGLSRSE